MKFSENDIKELASIGLSIDGEIIRIADKGKTHEFRIEDVGQLIVRRTFSLNKQFKASKMYAVIICGWDCSRIKLYKSDFDFSRMKRIMKRVNLAFYSEY